MNTFVEAGQSPIAIGIGVNVRQQGNAWGEIDDMEIMISGNKLVAFRHDAGLAPWRQLDWQWRLSNANLSQQGNAMWIFKIT